MLESFSHRRIPTCVVLLLLLMSSTVNAQTGVGTPPAEMDQEEVIFPEFFLAAVGDYPDGYYRDVIVEPGQSVELTVAVVNAGQIPVDLQVSRINAIVAINGGFYAAEASVEPNESTRMVNLDSFIVSLDPGTEHFETFTVTVPADATPGQYMTGLMAETASPVAIPGADILDQSLRYVISLSILVPGDLDTSFELGDASVTTQENIRRVVVPVENTGQYLVRPAGEVVLQDRSGNLVHRAPVELGSVYMGTSTVVWINLPEQMPGGIYQLSLNLVDPESGAADSIEQLEVTIPNLAQGSGISVGGIDIAPNAAEIAFANIEVLLINGGPQIPATNVTLKIVLDGEPIDEFPLATNQVMLAEDNVYTTRYIPPQMWESGTYTFHIIVESVDPISGQGTLLLEENLFTEIVVP